MNVEPFIGMNPGNNQLIITLGVRYQRSRWQTTESNDAIGNKGRSFDDTIVGAFVSIVCMFWLNFNIGTPNMVFLHQLIKGVTIYAT